MQIWPDKVFLTGKKIITTTGNANQEMTRCQGKIMRGKKSVLFLILQKPHTLQKGQWWEYKYHRRGKECLTDVKEQNDAENCPNWKKKEIERVYQAAPVQKEDLTSGAKCNNTLHTIVSWKNKCYSYSIYKIQLQFCDVGSMFHSWTRTTVRRLARFPSINSGRASIGQTGSHLSNADSLVLFVVMADKQEQTD